MGRMRVRLGCIIISVCLTLCLAQIQEVEVSIEGVTSIGTTDDNFICATLDWWPNEKCDYGFCSWTNAGLFNLDLKNKLLFSAVKEFSPLRIRIGGSLQDQIVYNAPNDEYSVKNCPKMQKLEKGMFGFSRGCLEMKRWDEINEFFNQTGVLTTLGLNALFGKKSPTDGSTTWVGDWNSQNARDLMKYTVSKGYEIDSYELGNELCAGGVSARLDADQYGRDFLVLKNLVKEVYSDGSTQPKVLGPAGFYDQQWFKTFLQVTGPNVVDGLTHHLYNLGAGVDPKLIDRIQDPYYLDQVAQTLKDIARTAREFGPWTAPWVGESGGAYNSGGREVSHTFADGFWYMDNLGMTAAYNHKVFCRQALIGGNYALLNTSTFIPNPDYYGALLWHRLMGTKVLAANHLSSPYLRSYAHCSRNKPGITLLLINMSNSTSFVTSVANDGNFHSGRVLTEGSADTKQREEYHLTPKDGNIQSDVVLLNGTPLTVCNNTLQIPHLDPKLVDPSFPIIVASDSIVFVTIRDFHAPACA